MISRTAVVTEAGTSGSLTPGLAANRLGFLSLLALSAWCGLVAGLLEVATIVVRKEVFDPDRLYKMSRHFVWLIPLSNVCIFLALGFFGCCVILIWPGRGRWLLTRGLAAMTVLPSILVAFPRIYSLAWLVVVLGLAVRLVPLVETRSRGFRRFAIASFPAAVAVVACLGASLWIGERINQARERARPLPPSGSPNVLLIVMDTVAADHMSLHGYDRATSATLVELAEQGIRFDLARATSSWTLPSHASMFTGRWLHELSVGWYTPLDRARPTLAEFLGERGYATAGFVANTAYCATDSGLSRGFTQYRDYIFPELTALKTAVLFRRALEGFQVIVYFADDWLASAGLLPYVQRLWRSLDSNRKGAEAVNHELLDWLSERTQSDRPFFAFLNYYDAHTPYQLPPGRLHRFGVEPADDYQRILIQNWWELDKTTVSAEGLQFAVAAYDDCIADLDEQLGILIDELDRRRVLEQTWLIVTADHGESFGEHAGVYCHGASLYETELHVPLVVIPPGGSVAKQTAKEAVSLRDLAATIVGLVGWRAGSPFPGESLARFSERPATVQTIGPASALQALAEVVPCDQRKHDYWGLAKRLSPLGAVKDGEWSYICCEEGVVEKLFHVTEDAKEHRNLTEDPSSRTILERMRSALRRLTEGPLVPERFRY